MSREPQYAAVGAERALQQEPVCAEYAADGAEAQGRDQRAEHAAEGAEMLPRLAQHDAAVRIDGQHHPRAVETSLARGQQARDGTLATEGRRER